MDDQVQLVGTVDGYALACEFPIEARCSVQGIEDSITVPPVVAIRKTNLERTSVERYITLEQEFSEVDQRLNGRVRASFLIDENGRPALTNNEATWEVPAKKPPYGPHLKLLNAEKTGEDYHHDKGQTCQDGILVCGTPGRTNDAEDRYRLRGSWRGNVINLGKDYFVLDVRGALKPPLTPARVPPARLNWASDDPRWGQLKTLASLAHGRLWQQVAQRLEGAVDGATLWQLLSIHSANVCWMPAGAIWLHVRIPLVRDGDSVTWQKFATINSLQAVDEDDSFALLTEDGDRVGFPDEMSQWIDENRSGGGEWLLKNAILNLSTVSVEGDTVRVAPREPNRPGRAPWEATFRSSLNHTPALEYTGPLSSVLSAQLPFVSVNRNHPLIESALAAQHREDRSEVQQFLVSAAYCLSNDSTLNALSKLGSSATYQMQRVGQRYLDVDWSGVIEYLKPPYKVWLREHGEVEVSQQDFERWAASNMDDI